MKDDGTRLTYKDLEASNKALVQALGVAHTEIEELIEQVELEKLTTAAHKKSQGYAFEDLEVMTTKYKEAQNLLDACYEVVEIWDCQAPSQIVWKREWLEKVRLHGAGGE
jgi:hypothetical protein